MTDSIHWNALAPETQKTFDALAALPVPADFYLAGGTALALQIGHRVSYDLDFFSSTNLLGTVERSMLARQLQSIKPSTIRTEADEQIYATLMGVEASFLYQHHALLFPTIEVQGIRLARPIDIGLMKLSAIKDRGTRRDFIDLYCLRHVAPYQKLFELLPQKYHDRPDFSVHLAYALSFFTDAENDHRELKTLKPIKWASVKKYCTQAAAFLAKINAGLEPPK